MIKIHMTKALKRELKELRENREHEEYWERISDITEHPVEWLLVQGGVKFVVSPRARCGDVEIDDGPTPH